MQPGNALLFAVGLSGIMAVVGLSYGPAAAYLPEMFATRYRYTGAGIGYNLAGILGGALPLIVAPPLTAAFGGIGVGVHGGARAAQRGLRARAEGDQGRRGKRGGAGRGRLIPSEQADRRVVGVIPGICPRRRTTVMAAIRGARRGARRAHPRSHGRPAARS